MITYELYRTKDKNKSVDNYLVDVPVKTNIWIRQDCQVEQLNRIKKAKPSILFFQSDGGRNEEEWEIIRNSRRTIEESINWNCTVHLIYADCNMGMYTMGKLAEEYIWTKVEQCIFLEDDHIPSVSFFEFCRELLEKYKDDLRVCAICGNNYTGIYEKTPYDYVFSRYFQIWGIAYWKRTYENYTLKYSGDDYTINAICRIAKAKWFINSVKGYAKGELTGGHIPGTEFYQNLNMIGQNQLFIFPRNNMISCWGIGKGSAHASDDIKKLSKGEANLFYSKTYEIDEIKHPSYIFPDLEFEKRQKKALAINPVRKYYRRAVRIIKRIRYGDGIVLLRLGINRLKEKRIEK